MFITFEGIDYSGKTTQANLLVERLQQLGKSVLLLREPGGTPLSEKIRTILLDKQHLEMHPTAELLLFSAARSQVVQQVILPALRQGTIVVCDRFYDSTTAYQGYGREIDLGDITAINRIATCGTIPDVTFIVDVDVEQVTRRRKSSGMSADRMESAGTQFFEKVRNGYLALAAGEPGRVIIIDGGRSKQEIQNEIWANVEKRLT